MTDAKKACCEKCEPYRVLWLEHACECHGYHTENHASPTTDAELVARLRSERSNSINDLVAATRIEGLAAQVQTLAALLLEASVAWPTPNRYSVAALAATSGEPPHSEEVMPDRPRRTEGDVPRPEESRGAGLHAAQGAAHPLNAEVSGQPQPQEEDPNG
jgi:hypothetical protein